MKKSLLIASLLALALAACGKKEEAAAPALLLRRLLLLLLLLRHLLLLLQKLQRLTLLLQKLQKLKRRSNLRPHYEKAVFVTAFLLLAVQPIKTLILTCDHHLDFLVDDLINFLLHQLW